MIKGEGMYQRMKRTGISLGMAAITAALLLALGPDIHASIKAGDITGGKKAPHVNIAVFHKLHGHDDFSYPKEVASGNILEAMQGKAQFIFLNHTSGLKDGDVISVATDVLRDQAGDFEDFGIDCQMTVHLKGNAVLSGICQILMLDQDGREIEHRAIVKPTTLASGKGWVLIYDDEEDGIAIYADENVGLE